MRPFLKWAGGKYRLVPKILAKLPVAKRLIEPFAGSCALSINTDYEQYWLNDLNQDLINLYQLFQQDGPAFIEYVESYFTLKNNSAKQYYKYRDLFNKTTDLRVKSTLLIYLNRHGYNGLSRYNANGGFNVPFGQYKNPYFPEKELLFFYEKLKNAAFTMLDFEAVMLAAVPGDVIYCDPPYVPLNATSNFTSYTAGGFDQEEQKRLANVAEIVAKRGIKTIISNHYNSFTADIYRQADLEIFSVQRFISCDGDNRNAVQEVLAVFG